MNQCIEQYGIAVFTLVLVAILIIFASPLGMKIKNATTEKVSTTEEIGCDEVYVATTGRSKPPTTVDDKVWIYIDKNNELVISKNKITAPTDALLKEKEINLKYFNTSNVTDMRCMFMGCSSLKYLDLSSFDISKSKDCNYMMDTNTSTTIKANSDLKAKFNRMSSETKITWE